MPEVFVVSNMRKNGKPVGAINAGQYWHSDLSYTARPTFASMLYATKVPAHGGETLFASMVRTYETLDRDLKTKIDGRRAIHDYTLAYETVFSDNPDRSLSPEQQAQVPPVEHPVVRTQAETGRRALYVNPGFSRSIVGMEESESRETLEALFAHASADANIYTHHWRAHDLVIWDNRITMHRAFANYDTNEPRHMLRTSVTGEDPGLTRTVKPFTAPTINCLEVSGCCRAAPSTAFALRGRCLRSPRLPARSIGLRVSAAAPSSVARDAQYSSSIPETMTTTVPESSGRRRTSRQSSSPFISDMTRSTTTTSGRFRTIRGRAVAPAMCW